MKGYTHYLGDPEKRVGLPVVLDLSMGVEWRCVGRTK